MISFLKLSEINKEFRSQFEVVFSEILTNGNFILGPKLQEFETAFSAYCQVKGCIGIDNGTNAIFLCLKVLNLKPGDEVIVAGNSYIATVLAILNNELNPVFVEPDITTYNIDPNEIESKITTRTKVILITHMYGSCCDMDAINSIAMKFNLLVIDDCSHAHGATYKNRPIGGLSDLSAFSFYPTKNLGALGDAGAITTNNAVWINEIYLLRNYGFVEKNIIAKPGYNARLDELQAAFLSIKLKKLSANNRSRSSIAKRYLKEIINPHIDLPKANDESSWHLFVIRTSKRSELMEHLKLHKIETAIHYPIPAYLQLGLEKWRSVDLPITNQLHREVLSIPLNIHLSEEEIDHIIHAINSFK